MIIFKHIKRYFIMHFKIENNKIHIYGKKEGNVIYEGNEHLFTFPLDDLDLEKFLFWAKHKNNRGHKGTILFLFKETPVLLAPEMWKNFIEFLDDYFVEQEVLKLKKTA